MKWCSVRNVITIDKGKITRGYTEGKMREQCSSLNKLGFSATDDIILENVWYFRNAIVHFVQNENNP